MGAINRARVNVRLCRRKTNAEASIRRSSVARTQLAATRAPTPFVFRPARLKLDFRQIVKATHVFVGAARAALIQINTHNLGAEEEERPPSSLIPSRSDEISCKKRHGDAAARLFTGAYDFHKLRH